MQFTFLGTGNAAEIPVFGCQCSICIEAKVMLPTRRKPCSAMVTDNQQTIFIDAGISDLHHRYQPEQIKTFLLTHYHMDHVQGLFPLRWGMGQSISVYGPPDEVGCDDLFKHSGLLRFEVPLIPFKPYILSGIEIVPLPLFHSKITYGYQITSKNTKRKITYLTDTSGLPEKTIDFLLVNRPHTMVIDCSYPPDVEKNKNHNDLEQVLALQQQILPTYTYLTHISHDLDRWIKAHGLPKEVIAAYDGLVLTL